MSKRDKWLVGIWAEMSKRDKWLVGIWAVAIVVSGVLSLDPEYTVSDDVWPMLLLVGFVTASIGGAKMVKSRYAVQFAALGNWVENVFMYVLVLAILGGLLYAWVVLFNKGAEIATDFAQDIFGSEPEDGWRCVERGQNMFSMSDSGELGAAEKGCTCEQMADFEYRVFGEVDFDALKDDHGCSF